MENEQPQKMSKLAVASVASLFLGAMLFCFSKSFDRYISDTVFFFFTILTFSLGISARKVIKANHGCLRGSGLTKVSISVSSFFLVLTLLF